LSSIPKSATEVQRTHLLKYVGTLQERNPSTCIQVKPDTEWLKHECKRGLHEFHDVYTNATLFNAIFVLAASAQIPIDAPNKHHTA